MKNFKNVSLCLGLGVLLLGGCGAKTAKAPQTSSVYSKLSDVQFAEKSFTFLVNGNAEIENMIDWESFDSVGTNVGQVYKGLPNDTQRAAFRQGFLKSFSASFLKTGAKAENIKNWKVKKKDGAKTVVVGGESAQKVLITVAQTPAGRKMLAIGLG